MVDNRECPECDATQYGGSKAEELGEPTLSFDSDKSYREG